ncbi:hypothetical protein [Variovorax sp. GT1P44]|uniref:hypothetical protein n=1 Tax=Variovorax sp. GT1P44 TaxID=3443742 RepID=UPI003F456002
MKTAPDPESGGAIFNPLSQMPAAAAKQPEAAAKSTAPPDSSVAATIVALLAGIATVALLLRKL